MARNTSGLSRGRPAGIKRGPNKNKRRKKGDPPREPKPVGNPAHVKTPEIANAVRGMRAVTDMTQGTIARILNIDEKTLVKYYRDELDLGRERAVNQVGIVVLNHATGGPSKGPGDEPWRRADINAAKYFLDRRGGPGWSPKVGVQGAIALFSADRLDELLDGVSEPELAKLESILGRLATGGGPGETGQD